MDRESAAQANRLVGNPDGAPVLEFCLAGARLKVLHSVELALTGAAGEGSHPRWRNFASRSGEEISLGALRNGVWSYLAVRGGFDGPRWFGSVSVNPRAGFGTGLAAGDRVRAGQEAEPARVAGRFLRRENRGDFSGTPELAVWPGPEWEMFSPEARACFFASSWKVSAQSDRTGYRLEGPALGVPNVSLVSSPLRVGAIQVPPAGQPVVILRDGPTVGGYPRLALLDPGAVSRFSQCAPGTSVRFQLVPGGCSVLTSRRIPWRFL